MSERSDTLVGEVPPLSRDRIGPYRIERVIGSGGMGVVYRAQAPDGRPVAVKILRTVLANRDLAQRFQREAGIRIQHRNLIQVLDAGTDDDGTPYIALELLEGESLARRFARGRLEPAEVVDLGVQVCAGLAAAHAEGIVHRDLKPGNLFRCSDGTVKILDFGIALAQSTDTRLTQTGSVLGTPSYLSPEQASDNSAVDARTDVWALGALLYEALAGRPPFDRDTPLTTIVAVMLEQPTPLVSIAAVPPTLAAVIERALEKPRDQRWQDAQSFAAALAGADLEATAAIPAALSPVVTAPAENRVVAILLAEGVGDLSTVERIIEGQRGNLIPVVGHRVIGLFGAGEWLGDEAACAVRAGLAIRGGARSVAVASGRVLRSAAGLSGAALKAAETGCAAALGGVAVDDDTARRLGAEFAYVDRGHGTWEVTAEMAPAASALATDVGGDKTPILGRQAEVAQLARALQAVLEEDRAMVVLVSGPPGIGKSRLRRELQDMLQGRAERPIVLTARAEPQRRQLALLADALRSRARDGEQLHGWPGLEAPTLEERRRAVLELAREPFEDAAEAAQSAEFLGELLGIQMPDTVTLLAARKDPRLMADRMRLAIQDYFAAAAGRAPLVLLLEDIQWADAASLELLDELLARLTDMPVLVFATARPELLEARPELFAGRELVKIVPQPLLVSDVAALAAAVAGQPLPDALVRALAERAAGNPLFVEQIVEELREKGRLDATGDDLPLPLTVEAAVQSRLDHLPMAEKELCKRGAVIGRPFSVEDVEALGVTGALPLLTALSRRDLLTSRRRSRGGGREYQFRSGLVAEVAYRMLTDEQRIELHRRGATYLAGLPDADAEEVASHHERGGQPGPAAEAYADAALAAEKRLDAETVLRCSGRALALEVAPARRSALHLSRADAYRYLARRSEQGEELTLALACATSNVDRTRALIEQAVRVWAARAGQIEEALAIAQQAVDAAEETGDPRLQAVARTWQGAALINARQLERARDVLQSASRLGRGADPGTRALVVEWQAQLAAVLGDLGERLDSFRTARDLYQEAGDPRRVAGAECNLADAYNRFGAYQEAETALRDALDVCRRVGNRVMEGYALVNLGYSLGMLKRTDDAYRVLDEAEAAARVTGDEAIRIIARVYRARAQVEAGAPGTVSLDEAVADAFRLGRAGTCVTALVMDARSALTSGELGRALERSTRALALRDEHQGIEEDEAEVFLVHAEALSANGQPEAAKAVLARGRLRLAEVAQGITDPQWRRRFLSDVLANRQLMAGGETS